MSTTDPTPTPRKSSYGNPAFADIARSMGVMAVIVLGLFFLGQLVWGNSPDEDHPTVDYAETVSQVREVATYPIYAPTSLPDGWGANGVTYEPGAQGRWHLGVLTDEGRYIGLEQANDSAQRLVETHAPDVEPDGEATAGGHTWQVFTGDGETTYVREGDKTTVLVTGTAPREDIERFIELLATE